jgi:DNA invertase Pin-like site-specific DNA recombinase
MIKHQAYVAYLRVSTKRQGRSGLGLDAQKEAIESYIASHGGTLLQPPFIEHESGKSSERPQLHEAIATAKRRKAILIIGKLDRLSRDAHFLLGLHKAGIEFVACDLPEANRFTLTIMAAVAEHEGRMISERTKAALQAAKRRGIKLGNPLGAQAFGSRGQLRGAAKGSEAMRAKANESAEGFRSLFTRLTTQYAGNASAIARQLNEDGETTPRGRPWNPMQVIRTMDRLGHQA